MVWGDINQPLATQKSSGRTGFKAAKEHCHESKEGKMEKSHLARSWLRDPQWLQRIEFFSMQGLGEGWEYLQ